MEKAIWSSSDEAVKLEEESNNMKKLIKILITLLLIIAAAAVAFLLRYGDLLGINIIKPSPEKYVKQAVVFMDSQGIYASGDEWEKTKAEVLEKAAKAESYEECHELINNALKVAGGKHSRLITEDKNNAAELEMPSCEIDDRDKIYIRIPAFSGSTDEGMKYAETVYDFLRENGADASEITIDIRDNHGGDMGPMVAAVSPLLPDGELMYFDMKGTKQAVTLAGGTVSGGGSQVTMDDPFKIKDVPVRILQNEETGSSAEALLICFRGLDNVKSYGTPTAGYCSCNTTRKLYDGAVMLLTIGKDVARTGEEFCEEPIAPDVTD